MGKKRTFNRKTGRKRYKKVFIISVEGSVTERQYFNWFKQQHSAIHIKCINKRDQSAPRKVLKKMKQHLKDNNLNKNDEAWLVVDRDGWQEEHLNELFSWSDTNPSYGLALSNPNFEYWLLLHFEDGRTINNSHNCKERLLKYIPKYNKSIDMRHITVDMIKDAIDRAKRRDNPPCESWPDKKGSTTVYKLAQNILNDIS